MKKVTLLLSLLLLISTASGQNQLEKSEESKPLKILSKKIQITNIYSIMKSKPASVVNITPNTAPPIYDSRSGQPSSISQDVNISRQGGLEVVNRPKESSTPKVIGYIITATIQIENHSNKAVKSVKWEYVIGNSQTEKPIKKFRFKTVDNIAPDEKATITETGVVLRVSKVPDSNYNEAFITEIEFADGTKWKRPKDEK